jgi:2-desacetyl-2-hydroxyethyl bacteriochlorophyllide A dehydrogenase
VKSVVLEAPGRIALRESPPPGPPGPHEALVAVRCVGVCGTDLHAFRGAQAFMRYPVVLGHELAVEVLELGPSPTAIRDDIVPGARCAVVPYLADGSCPACRRGLSNCCATLRVLGVHVDGGMCDRLLVPRANLVRADDLSDTDLAMVEMLAVGAHAVRRGDLRSGERVLVIGAGPIGLATMLFAAARGAEVAAVDVARSRVDAARALGVARRTLAGEDLDDDALASLFDGRPADVVVDATGSAASMARATRCVAIGGRVVFVGHTRGGLEFDNPTLHGKELTLVFSRNATREDIDASIAALRAGTVAVDAWVTDRATADEAAERLPAWAGAAPPATKAVIDWIGTDGDAATGRPHQRGSIL